MPNTTVLVTGAGGFIGSHLTLHLAQLGYDVRALDVRPAPGVLLEEGIAYTRADIRDASALASLLRGVDTVFHLASVHLEVNAAPAQFEAVNVRAVADLVDSCARAGVRRLVHTSSVGIYGHVAQPPAREDSPANPQNTYDRTKLAGERAALRAATDVGLDLVVLRPAWVYGPRCPRTAKLLRTIKKGRFVYVGRGTNLRHPIYVADMMDAYVAAAAAPPTVAGRAYIIAGPRPHSLRDIIGECARAQHVRPPRLAMPRSVAYAMGLTAEWAFAAVRREPPMSRRSLAFFENTTAFDTTLAARELAFRAKIELPDGLDRTVAAANLMQPAHVA